MVWCGREKNVGAKAAENYDLNFRSLCVKWCHIRWVTSTSPHRAVSQLLSSLGATHFAQHICHSSNTHCNLFHTKYLKIVSAASNTACGDSKQRPLESLLPVGNRKITGRAVWAVGITRNHFHTMWGQDIPTHCITSRHVL